MNHYFTQKVSQIRQNLQPTNLDPMINFDKLMEGKNLENGFKINKITMQQLRTTINKMKPSNSVGTDGISIHFIKDYLPYLEKPLLNLTNQSIHQGIFPHSLNTSKIIPILKPGKPGGNMASYRPINLLSAISKIIEKLLIQQITKHSLNNKLVSHSYQGAFNGNQQP